MHCVRVLVICLFRPSFEVLLGLRLASLHCGNHILVLFVNFFKLLRFSKSFVVNLVQVVLLSLRMHLI